jgi:CBS domain-containing protein
VKARDIMEPINEYLSPQDTLKEAVNKMKVAGRGADCKIGVRGMIVLDDKGDIVGMVSVNDILRAIIPFYLTETLSEYTWDGMLEEMCRKVADKKVEEIMSKNVYTVPEDAPLMECADFVVQRNLQRLPVVNREKKVSGIIYLRDLYYAVVKALVDEGGQE